MTKVEGKKMVGNSYALLFIFIFSWSASELLLSAKAQNDIEQNALFDFYNAVENKDKLFNWNSNITYCSWAGVSCNGIAQVTHLDLNKTGLVGSIPESIANLTNLHVLDLSFNYFTGRIPLSISRLASLANLTLGHNNLTGSIPDDLGSSGSLVVVDLSENHLVGGIPSAICQSSGLEILTLTNNLLNGSIPLNISACASLQNLFLGTNSLEGGIPDSIGKLTNLIVLDLSNNGFTGLIPPKFEQSGLEYLSLAFNSLEGNISVQLGSLSSLTLLSLAHNHLEGPIPIELGGLAALGELLLQDNRLKGSIPSSLGSIKKLQVLDLSLNGLTGVIPDELGNLSILGSLLLMGNQLSGPIPSSLKNCLKLFDLELADNNLTGSIPPEIGSISGLSQLNLSWNFLDGPIPKELGELQKLTFLDLSHNRLQGKVPKELAQLGTLLYIDLAFNELNGSLPPFRPNIVNATQFAGNPGLCGAPLPSCGKSGNTRGDQGHNIHIWTAVITGIGVALVLLILGAVIFCYWRFRCGYAPTEDEPKIPSAEGRLFLVDDRPMAFSYDEAVEATQLISQDDPVGKGRFSTVYRVVMPSGQEIAAKKLKLDADNSSLTRVFTAELHKIEKMQHRNLLRLLGYVLQGDSLFLLYDFCSNGSLGEWLHRRPEAVLEWSTRYKVAVGAAQGLAYLHHSIHPPFIHRDVNTNNILLDASFEPLLGDVGLAKLYDPSKETESMTAVAGSFGYIAPEYAYTMRVTEKSNVYSFGVVLLEILTGKQPVEPSFGEGCDLVSWVHGGPQRKETPEQILDSSVSTASFSVRQEMLSVLKIAKLCTNSLPAERPRMKAVVEMLQKSKFRSVQSFSVQKI